MAKVDIKPAIDAIRATATKLIDTASSDAQEAQRAVDEYLVSVEPDVERLVAQAATAKDPSTWVAAIDAVLDTAALREAEALDAVEYGFENELRAASLAAVHTLIAVAVAAA